MSVPVRSSRHLGQSVHVTWTDGSVDDEWMRLGAMAHA